MTSIRSEQIRDGDVKRADLNTDETGSAVIRKVIAGYGVSISSTGVDTGTGDVTIAQDGDDPVKLPETTTPSPVTSHGLIYSKADGKLYYLSSAGVETAISTQTQTFSVSLFISTVENKTYVIGQNLPFAGTITKVTTISSAGTATITGKINGTSLGGTANSASSSEQSQSHSSSNAFSAGDDITIVASSNSSCVNLAVTIEFTRALAFLDASTKSQTYAMSAFIGSVANQDYTILRNSPFAGTVKKVTTKSASGTATVTTKINSTALGGTANSASSTEQEQSHSSSNAFAIGDDIICTVSSNSSCTDLAITVEYTRNMLGSSDDRYGYNTLTASASYVDITFGTVTSNANYTVAVEVPYQTAFWVSNKTTSGFRINVGTTSGSNQTISWSVRPYS